MIKYSCDIYVVLYQSARDICLIIISVTASGVVKYRIFTGSEDLSRRGLLGARFLKYTGLRKNLLFHVERPGEWVEKRERDEGWRRVA